MQTLPLSKMSYANSPFKYMTTLIPKLLPLFFTNDKGKVTERLSSSHHWKSQHPHHHHWNHHQHPHPQKPLEKERETLRCHQGKPVVVRAIIDSRVTPPAEEEGANVDGVEEAGGVAVSIYGRFGQSQASLCLSVAAIMAHTTEK